MKKLPNLSKLQGSPNDPDFQLFPWLRTFDSSQWQFSPLGSGSKMSRLTFPIGNCTATHDCSNHHNTQFQTADEYLKPTYSNQFDRTTQKMKLILLLAAFLITPKSGESVSQSWSSTKNQKFDGTPLRVIKGNSILCAVSH